MTEQQTKRDLDNEQAVMAELEKKWNCVCKKTGQFDEFDVEIYNRSGVLELCAEIKCRDMNKKTYPDYRVSINKIKQAVATSKRSGVKTVLVLLMTDGLWYCYLNNRFKVDPNFGRDDRNIPTDRGPAAIIPWADFKLVSKGLRLVDGVATPDKVQSEIPEQDNIRTPKPKVTPINTDPNSLCHQKMVLMSYMGVLDSLVKRNKIKPRKEITENLKEHQRVWSLAFAEHMLMCPKCKDRDE